jgi:hypothetical protein
MATRPSPKPPDTSPEILMLGYLCVMGVEGLPEKVSILDRFGLVDTDIATICNAVVGSVRNARLQVRKGSKAE